MEVAIQIQNVWKIFGNNSKQSQKKYNSGNCVAMSINLQNMLKKHIVT